MAQFRNCADIFDEILQKCGEPTNGNSPYESLVQIYANKVHHAIIGGGSIFNINVDEPWVWARSHFPMVVELQPAITTGFISCSNGSNNITFSTTPISGVTGSAASVEGWHIQAMGLSTVYKIMNHTAGGTTAQIDSSFVDTTGTYSFRCMKIDYPIFPAYMYVDNSNDRLDFQENGTAGNTTSNLTALIPHGAYAPGSLAATVATQMGSLGTAAYTCAYDTVANTFFISASQTFALLGASGSNAGGRNALPAIGFDKLDQTAALSYTSTYQPNQVGRLIEPFKMFMSNWWGENFCYSTDPIKMQEDYPIARMSCRFPDRFCRISEDNNGVIWVRFNAYPIQLTKLQIDWIPQPIDLQDNTASFTRMPRGDVDALIHGASAFIMLDKNDSKYSNFVELAKTHLDAMKKKNHGMLFRTGQAFGQIIPRQDLNRAVRRLNFGYTVDGGSTAAMTTIAGTPCDSMTSFTLGYGRWSAANTVSSATGAVLPANCAVLALLVQLSQPFTGPLITGVSLNVGIQGDSTKFVNSFDVAQATPAQTSVATFYFPATSTPILVQLTSVGGNLNALTAGMLSLSLQETVVP